MSVYSDICMYTDDKIVHVSPCVCVCLRAFVFSFHKKINDIRMALYLT